MAVNQVRTDEACILPRDDVEGMDEHGDKRRNPTFWKASRVFLVSARYINTPLDFRDLPLGPRSSASEGKGWRRGGGISKGLVGRHCGSRSTAEVYAFAASAFALVVLVNDGYLGTEKKLSVGLASHQRIYPTRRVER